MLSSHDKTIPLHLVIIYNDYCKLSIIIHHCIVIIRHGSGASNWEQWVERLEDYVKDYENETTWRSKVTQEDCGDLAVNPPGRKSICKVKPTELFQVKFCC